MNRPWPDEALAFGDAVADAMARLGGVDFARECEQDATLREKRLAPVLRDLGFSDLDVDAGAVETAAAALGVRAAGQVVAPWPLPQMLAAPHALRGEVDAVYLSLGGLRRAEHLDLAAGAAEIDLVTGTVYRLERAGRGNPAPLDPFGVPCSRAGVLEHDLNGALSIHIVLTAFWVAGALEYAMQLATSYSTERVQFGRPIAAFGAVQWMLSDIALAFAGLSELARYTLALTIDGSVTLADAFALRLQMIESANIVLANAHQVLGAIGLCEEHDLVIIDRHVQASLRRPAGIAATNALLAERIALDGFSGLFPAKARAVEA